MNGKTSTSNWDDHLYISYVQELDEDRFHIETLTVEKGADLACLLSGKVFDSFIVHKTEKEMMDYAEQYCRRM